MESNGVSTNSKQVKYPSDAVFTKPRSGSFDCRTVDNAATKWSNRSDISSQLQRRDSADKRATTPLNQYSSGPSSNGLSSMGIPYLANLLSKSLTKTTSDHHIDPAAQSRAKLKIQQLLQAIGGITSGTVNPGSRAPITNTPEWLTPVVIDGGFVTGELVAGGPLTDHEIKLAKESGILATEKPLGDHAKIRSALNRIWFNEPYFSRLSNMLDSGKYRVNAPEEAVMLVVVALHRFGHSDKAEELINTISPYMCRVRFFPEPAENPLPMDLNKPSKSMEDVVKRLEKRFSPDLKPRDKTNTRKRIEKKALVIDQWLLPLNSWLLRLFRATVKGDGLPRYNTEGELCGGMPLANVTQKWFDEARRYQARRKETLAKYPELKHRTTRKRGSERILQRSLEALLAYSPEHWQTSDREGLQKIQSTLRRTLADIHRKHGMPELWKEHKIRENTTREVAVVTAHRFKTFLFTLIGGSAPLNSKKPNSSTPKERSDTTKKARLEVSDATSTTKANEARLDHWCWSARYRESLREGRALIEQLQQLQDCNQFVPEDLTVNMTKMPKSVKALLEKLQPRSLSERLERGYIASAETLSSELLKIIPVKRSESIRDPSLATLFAQVALAFNKRRSLLLVDLTSQVKINDLPWVKHLQTITPREEGSEREAAQNLIKCSINQMLEYFPQTIFPNTFIKSLNQMIKALQESRGGTHQINDSTVNIRNGEGSPCISRLLISEENNSETGSSEKAGSLKGSIPEATALPEGSFEQLPLTEELAADVFMDAFSEKYLLAAKQAASLMQGSIYEKCYGLDYKIIANLKTPKELYELCLTKSGVDTVTLTYDDVVVRCRSDRRASTGGKVVEWQQVITTHNLAALANATNPDDFRGGYGGYLSHRVADWIVTKCKRYNPELPDQIRLQQHKNVAYAFRQMVFFLSFQPEYVQFSVLEKLKTIPQKLDIKISAISARKVHTETPEASRVSSMDLTGGSEVGGNEAGGNEGYAIAVGKGHYLYLYDCPTQIIKPSKKQLLSRMHQKKIQVNKMIICLEFALGSRQTQERPEPFVAWL